MQENPFEPPRAEVAQGIAPASRPAIIEVLATISIVFMLAAVVLAVLSQPIHEAVMVVFFSAFLCFVPIGLLRGRPWAPAATMAMGLFVAAFVFGRLLVSWQNYASFVLAFRFALGVFALLLAAAMLHLRKHRHFGVVAARRDDQEG